MVLLNRIDGSASDLHETRPSIGDPQELSPLLGMVLECQSNRNTLNRVVRHRPRACVTLRDVVILPTNSDPSDIRPSDAYSVGYESQTVRGDLTCDTIL